MKLTIERDIRIYLPSELEQHESLDEILNECLAVGASETSSIVSWVMFEACDDENMQIQIVRKCVAKVLK